MERALQLIHEGAPSRAPELITAKTVSAEGAPIEAVFNSDRAASAPFCAMFIDLDYFKHVNDTGGHAAGDALLRDVAQTLLAQVRQTDTVARLGGDEFAVLLVACPLPQALEIGEKLRSAVEAYRLLWEGQSFSVSTSIGLVAVDGRYTAIADVLRDADTACYQAKERGRNAVVAFEPAAAPPPLAPPA